MKCSVDATYWLFMHCLFNFLVLQGDDQFAKPIRSAQFYYLDKFLLLASGSNLMLYLYHLDTTRDDIKSYKQLMDIDQVTINAGCWWPSAKRKVQFLGPGYQILECL